MFAVNVEGIIIKENKILICRRSLYEEHAGGQLSLIGGTVEQEGNCNNILEKTLQREIMEEVGLIVDNFRYINNSSFLTESGVHVINLVFACNFISGNEIIKDTKEISELEWLTIDEILSNKNSPSYLIDSIKTFKDIFAII